MRERERTWPVSLDFHRLSACYAQMCRNMQRQTNLLAHQSICLICASSHTRNTWILLSKETWHLPQAEGLKSRIMSWGTTASDSRLLLYSKTINGKGNVFQPGTICWFALLVGISHWGTQREDTWQETHSQADRGGKLSRTKPEDALSAILISRWKTGSRGRDGMQRTRLVCTQSLR